MAEAFCDRALVLVDETGFSAHDVSREVYDAVDGSNEIVLTPVGGAPVWSKVIATDPIKVKLFTFQPPRSEVEDTPVSKVMQGARLSTIERGD